ncbi:hypothetical protein [Noviherbaspirillum autotrophicum]|uniref:Uncharacterized protein n=1 Tax=Noviherbaspirillum autotrophicum TaxID=709839 RepID=A0A0C2BZA3_9BURK|nr:hypothetical protein [Noviherbaspirillum autotrophicum]KIF83341.1 hypothetical protein TSA66_24915 [Noviherbaspirillum autotrophicum]
MDVGGISSVSNYLQQIVEIRKQQSEVDAQVAESMRRVRQQVVDQGLQDGNKQAERINEIKRTGLQPHGGSIDVWA